MFSRVPRNTIRGLRLRSSAYSHRNAHPRFQSTSPPKPDSSTLYGGLVGGSIVIVGTYAWYHLSGTRSVVQTAKSTIATAQQAKDRFAEATPSPKEALGFLQFMAKRYAPFPGVDRAFDEIERVAEKHGDRVADIVNRAYKEVSAALKDGDTKDAGSKVFAALQRSMQEIRELSGDVFGPMLDRSPELKRVLGTSYEQLKSTADRHGPEAQRIASETYAQLAQLVGQGVNAVTIKDASELLQKKTQEVSQLAAKSGGDAWEAARDSAQPLMDRLPDLKKVLDENVESLKGYIGEERVNIVKDLYTQLEALSKSGKSANEIKDQAQKIVQEKVDELRKQGGNFDLRSLLGKGGAAAGGFDLGNLLGSGEGLEKLKSVPGLGGIVDQIPRLKELQTAAEKRGPEAKKLLDETYDEIKKILDAKLEEAKKIGGEAKEDAKQGGDAKAKDEGGKGDKEKRGKKN